MHCSRSNQAVWQARQSESREQNEQVARAGPVPLRVRRLRALSAFGFCPRSFLFTSSLSWEPVACPQVPGFQSKNRIAMSLLGQTFSHSARDARDLLTDVGRVRLHL